MKDKRNIKFKQIICVCVYTYIYIYIYIHVHTNIDIYVYIDITYAGRGQAPAASGSAPALLPGPPSIEGASCYCLLLVVLLISLLYYRCYD